MEANTYHIEAVGIEAYQKLKNEWNELFDRVANAVPCLSFPWVDSFIRHRRIRGKVCILTVWASKKLVAIWPLTIRKIWGIKVAEPIGTGYPSYLGLLLDTEHSAAIGPIAKSFLSKNLADIYLTNDFSSEDIATQKLMNNLTLRHCKSFLSFRNVCRYIQLGCSFEDYLRENKSSKSRQTLRRKERTLSDQHSVIVEYYKGDVITAGILERIALIQKESWMERRGAAVLGQTFYQDLLSEMAKKGFGRVWIMMIDGEDAAFIYESATCNYLQYQWTAFKLKYQSYPSIGMVLTMHSIRQACDDGIVKYNFGHGDADYKRFWANRDHMVSRMIAGYSFKGKLMVYTINLVWKLSKVKWLKKLYRYIRHLRLFGKDKKDDLV